jgi:hypothetical protein
MELESLSFSVYTTQIMDFVTDTYGFQLIALTDHAAQVCHLRLPAMRLVLRGALAKAARSYFAPRT